MNRFLAAMIIAVLALACSGGCGSGGSGNDGGSTNGSCTAVDVCATIPLAQLNMACGAMATTTKSSMMSSVNACDYNGATGTEGQITRACYPMTSIASATYASDHDAMPTTGETKTDVTGVGDKAYFSSHPAINSAELQVLKGNVVLSITCNSVKAGQESAVQAALAGVANTLLAK